MLVQGGGGGGGGVKREGEVAVLFELSQDLLTKVLYMYSVHVHMYINSVIVVYVMYCNCVM